MVSRKLSPIRKAQKKLLESFGAVADSASRAADAAGQQLKKLDERHGVSGAVRDQGTRAAKVIRDLDSEYGVTEKAREAGKVVSL